MVISSKLAEAIGDISVHYGIDGISLSLLKSHYRPLNSKYWYEEPKKPFFLLEVFSLFDSPFFGKGTGWSTPTVSEGYYFQYAKQRSPVGMRMLSWSLT